MYNEKIQLKSNQTLQCILGSYNLIKGKFGYSDLETKVKTELRYNTFWWFTADNSFISVHLDVAL